jgi:ribosomal protein S18 acetylase RimI-like enzyme
MATMIRQAGPKDMGRLDAALRSLAADLGDDYHGSVSGLTAACHGAAAFAGAVLAESDGAVAGAALFTPIYSTTQGGAGVRVSDLWVAATARGAGLGRRLLAEAARAGAARWGACFLMIAVYADNARAAAFYERLGFAFPDHDRIGILGPGSFRALLAEAA